MEQVHSDPQAQDGEQGVHGVIPSPLFVAEALDRVQTGGPEGRVEAVAEPKRDRTLVVHVAAPKSLAGEIRAIRVVN